MKESFTRQNHPSLSACKVLQAGHFKEDPSHGIERSGIDEHILIYCISGNGRFGLEGMESRIGPGDMLVIPGQRPHAYWADPESPWDIYWVHFSGNAGLFYQQAVPHICNGVLQIGYRQEIINLFTKILLRLSKPFQPMTAASADACLILLLEELISAADGWAHDFDALILRMQEHVSQRLSLSRLATWAGLSKYHFSREFKSFTGHSPMEYFRRLKISTACDRLSNTTASIAKISEDLNYSSPYHFSEQFRSITGYRPSRFRRLVRGGSGVPLPLSPRFNPASGQ